MNSGTKSFQHFSIIHQKVVLNVGYGGLLYEGVASKTKKA